MTKNTNFRFLAPKALDPGGLNKLFKELLESNCQLSAYFDTSGIDAPLDEYTPDGLNDHSNTLFWLLSMEL